MTHTRTVFMLACCLLVISFQAQSQDLAAVLTVIYGDVELRRGDTADWLMLTPGAAMPVGVGDALRTDENGRALLDLPLMDGALLLLPNSELRLNTYTLTDQQVPHLDVQTVFGETIHQSSGDGHYRATAGDFAVTVEQSPAHFIISADDGAAVVVVAAGTVLLDDVPLTAGTGGHRLDAASEPTYYDDLTAPTSPAAVVGRVRGCAGMITTQNGENLNARIGPSTRNPQLGQFPDSANVQVMGVVASGGWYRVQFRSGFGWVERLALTILNETCEIPMLPDDSYDLPSTIFNVTEPELALMEPFYGTPGFDPIFYQFAPVN